MFCAPPFSSDSRVLTLPHIDISGDGCGPEFFNNGQCLGAQRGRSKIQWHFGVWERRLGNDSAIGRAVGKPLGAENLTDSLWSAPLKRMRVLHEGSHKEIFDYEKAKTTKA